MNTLLMEIREPSILQTASCMEAQAAAFLQIYWWHQSLSQCGNGERGRREGLLGLATWSLPLHCTYRCIFPWDCKPQPQASQGFQPLGFSLPLGHSGVGRSATCTVQCHPTCQRGCHLSALFTVFGRKGLTADLIWSAAILPSFGAHAVRVALEARWDRARKQRTEVERSGE